MTSSARWPLLLIFACLPLRANAETLLSAEVGWANHYRMGRWVPVFVTASDPTPRDVILELYAPHDRRNAMRLHEAFTIGPAPITIPLYVPLSYNLDETTVTLRSATSGRGLADVPLADSPMYARPPGSNSADPTPVEATDLFIGLSGLSASERGLEGQFNRQHVTVGWLPQGHLPAVAVGYDALDLLLLNQPDPN